MTGITGISGTSDAAGYVERMRRIQHAFIDDPRKAAHDADRLACDLVQACSDELTRRRSELAAGPGDREAPDTERLRQSVRRYREFVDALVQTVSTADDEQATALSLPEETTYQVGENGQAEAVDPPVERDAETEASDRAPGAEPPDRDAARTEPRRGADVSEWAERPAGP